MGEGKDDYSIDEAGELGPPIEPEEGSGFTCDPSEIIRRGIQQLLDETKPRDGDTA